MEAPDVRTCIDQQRRRELRRHAASRGVEGKLADGDPHAVRTEVAKAEDALAARHDDAADVALRPVSKDLAETALPFDRQVQAARPAEEVAELLTSLADGRRVDDRHKPGWVGQ